MRQPYSAPARYRLTQRAYISPRPGLPAVRLEPGAEITYDGRPGPHMEPLDNEAKDAVTRANPQLWALNPALRMPMTGGFSEAQAMQLQQAGLLMPDTERTRALEAEVAQLRAALAAKEAPAAEPPAPSVAAVPSPPPPPPLPAPKGKAA